MGLSHVSARYLTPRVCWYGACSSWTCGWSRRTGWGWGRCLLRGSLPGFGAPRRLVSPRSAGSEDGQALLGAECPLAAARLRAPQPAQNLPEGRGRARQPIGTARLPAPASVRGRASWGKMAAGVVVLLLSVPAGLVIAPWALCCLHSGRGDVWRGVGLSIPPAPPPRCGRLCYSKVSVAEGGGIQPLRCQFSLK